MQLNEFLQASLMLDQWDRFSRAECEKVARDLEGELPASFRFHKVETCTLGDQKHHVAFFEWAGSPHAYYHAFFVLIPGSEATLGYDRDHPFIPTQQQKKSWEKETQQTGLFNDTLDGFLDQVMTSLRRVTIQPFLLETLATPLELPPTYEETLGPKGGWTKQVAPISYEQTLHNISRQGFRFPTSDEWEYACASGARTLFRWGNATPDSTVPRLGNRKAGEWDFHLQQNAFGLFIARSPYDWEFCDEREIIRGGDGGSALHGGAGTFAAWLTLASPFHLYGDHARIYGVYLRRAFPLS
jgi:hypothetical protein